MTLAVLMRPFAVAWDRSGRWWCFAQDARKVQH
jgi:hypothetical protein